LKNRINIGKLNFPALKSPVFQYARICFTCFKTICSEIAKNISYFLDQHILPDTKCKAAMTISYATKGKMVKTEGTEH